MSLLSVKHLTKNFGGLCAVSNVSMEINEHELIGLIGPNGAGKTTLFNLLTGVYEPSEGSIELNVDGKMTEIGGMKPYRVTQMGLSRTFQNIRLFKNMTALENVKVAMHKDIQYGTLAAILRLPSYYREEERVQKQAEELLRVVGLYEKRDERASNLPYGEQRRLEIARALAADPQVLLMDEPFGALDPVTRGALQQEMTRIHRLQGRTIVLVTHDIDEALRLAEHLVLMDHGEVVQQGNPLTMLTRPANDFVRQFFGRSELGVRLLSLRSVADYVRREERAEGEALEERMTLRDALSLFVARGCEVLPVVNTQGEPCGTLHFQDLLEEA